VVTGTDQAGNTTTAAHDFTVIAAAEPADLSLSQSVGTSTPVVGSQTYVYLAVSNSGPAVASDIEVAHLLGAGLTIDSVTPSQGSYDSGTGVWSIGQLGMNGSATLLLYVTVGEAGPYTTSASITSSNRPDPDPSDDTTAQITLTPVAPPP
jgi:uncharacterized repeat protein (TIGR01451 family)